MITNDKQYIAAKRKLSMLKDSLAAPIKKGVPEVIAKAGNGQIQEKVNEIRSSIERYENAKNSGNPFELVRGVAKDKTMSTDEIMKLTRN